MGINLGGFGAYMSKQNLGISYIRTKDVLDGDAAGKNDLESET